jgi:hypothetical protein
VRVSIVADPSYDNARELIHQASRLHLEAEHAAKIVADFISFDTILYHLISRSDQPVMYSNNVAWRPGYNSVDIAIATVVVIVNVIVLRFKEDVVN